MGLVGAPFGLKGFVKVRPFSGETSHFSHLREIVLRQDEKDKARKVAEVTVQGDSVLLRFEGVDSPEAAALLNGAEIIAAREFAAPLNEGEFYVEDLKGLEVVSGEGKSLGRVSNVIEGGGGFLAEVKLASGDIRLAPFRKEFFGDVDLELGKVPLLEPWILDE